LTLEENFIFWQEIKMVSSKERMYQNRLIQIEREYNNIYYSQINRWWRESSDTKSREENNKLKEDCERIILEAEANRDKKSERVKELLESERVKSKSS
jgi:hypothetical protein